MQLRKEYPRAERNTALYTLLTCTRSVEPVRVGEYHPLATDEFRDSAEEKIDAARDHLAQTESNTQLLEGGWTSLSEIDAAFERHQKGQYGLCEDCGNEISLERLEVLPLTPYCLDCHQKRERKPVPEENTQDHDSESLLRPAALESAENQPATPIFRSTRVADERRRALPKLRLSILSARD
jgi:RNA polymerase-binding transcription factor DksA